MVFCVNKRHMTSENSVPYAACSVLIDIYGLVLGDVQLSLQLCDHLCVLLIGQMNRIRIGDLKTTAELKATFVFRNDMEMQVRQLVAVSTQIDLGAAPQLLDSACGISDIVHVVMALLLGQVGQLSQMLINSNNTASLVRLILEQIQNALSHLTDTEHNCLAAFVLRITVKTTHHKFLLFRMNSPFRDNSSITHLQIFFQMFTEK